MDARINEEGILILSPYGSTEKFAVKAWKNMGAKIGVENREEKTPALESNTPPVSSCDDVTVVLPPVSTPTLTTNDVENDTLDQRAAIKKELEALGVPFNNKARTEVLAKLLEDQRAAVKQAPVVAPSAPEASALPTQPAAPSIEVVREAVKKYAAIKGAPKAMELLGKYKANKVSELPLDSYAAVAEFVNQETK